MKTRLPKIDGLSFAISKLVYLVEDLLEEHFRRMGFLSPQVCSGLDLRAVTQEEARVVVQIQPIGWKDCFINASFYRCSRNGKDWDWTFGPGAIVILGMSTMISFVPVRNASGKIVLGRVAEEAKKVPLVPGDLKPRTLEATSTQDARVSPDVGSPPGGYEQSDAD